MKDSEFESLVLHLLENEATARFDGCALQNLSVEKQVDLVGRAMIVKLRTLIPAEDMKSETHTLKVSYPAGWWQAFKKQYFTAWLRKRFPIQYTTTHQTIEFTAYNLYPKLPLEMETGGDQRQIIISNVGMKRESVLYSVWGVQYDTALRLIEDLAEHQVRANITPGGIAIYPDGLTQVDNMDLVCEKYDTIATRGFTPHEESVLRDFE